MKPLGAPYNCASYRRDMTLLGLLRRLHDASLSEAERDAVRDKVKKLESETELESFADDP